MSSRRSPGSLEHLLMAQLWNSPDGLTPGESTEALRADGTDLAHTTVMTVLTRVYEKGLASREPEGRTFRYRATHTEAESSAGRMHDALTDTADRAATLAKFVAELTPDDNDALRRLLRELGP